MILTGSGMKTILKNFHDSTLVSLCLPEYSIFVGALVGGNPSHSHPPLMPYQGSDSSHPPHTEDTYDC